MEENEKSAAKTKKSFRFWRTQWECLQKALLPALMYMFMSTLLLASQLISADNLVWLKISLGIVCILIGAAFNAHLCFTFGKTHYDAYVAGQAHKNDALFGIETGKVIRTELEYRPWKGFYIGFLVGVPVIILGAVAAAPGAMASGWAAIVLILFAGWAIMPVSWFGATGASFAYSIFMIILPVAVSGAFYIVGAMFQKRKKREQAERAQRVKEAAEQARQERVMREQTEEQRRKTLQSKKKKR